MVEFRACGSPPRTVRRWCVLLALTVVTGHIADRTTGQPLTGVDVAPNGSAKIAPGRTDGAGKYTLRDVPPGHYTFTVSSDDVPPQMFTVVVGSAKTQHFDITACSTTLDYSCAAGNP